MNLVGSNLVYTKREVIEREYQICNTRMHINISAKNVRIFDKFIGRVTAKGIKKTKRGNR